MKRIKLIWLLPVSLILFTGCFKEQEITVSLSTGTRITISAGQERLNDPLTRTTFDGKQTLWKAGDRIGIYSPQATTADGKPAENVPFTARSSGKSSLFDGEIYWGEGVHEFYAYYPYKEGNYSMTGIPMNVPTVQYQSEGNNAEHLDSLDIMVAEQRGVLPNANTPLYFRHVLSLLEIKVLSEGELSNLKIEKSWDGGYLTIEDKEKNDGTLDIGGGGINTTYGDVTGSYRTVELRLGTPAKLTINKLTTPAFYLMVLGWTVQNTDITLSAVINGEKKYILFRLPMTLDMGMKYTIFADFTNYEAVITEGVQIGDILWAPSNLVKTDERTTTFAPYPTDDGDYFSWNSMETTGFSANGTTDPCQYANFEGRNWRMPSKEDFLALVNSGYTEEIENNGVKGRMFNTNQSKEEEKLFMPNSGYRWKRDISETKSTGYYWTAEKRTDNKIPMADVFSLKGIFPVVDYSVGYTDLTPDVPGIKYSLQLEIGVPIRCVSDLRPHRLPILNTSNITALGDTFITINGIFADMGMPRYTKSGFCYSTSPHPTVEDHIIENTDSTPTSIFAEVTGLTARTTYYIRAYATNIVGTVYGEEIEFTTTGGSIFDSEGWKDGGFFNW